MRRDSKNSRTLIIKLADFNEFFGTTIRGDEMAKAVNDLIGKKFWLSRSYSKGKNQKLLLEKGHVSVIATDAYYLIGEIRIEFHKKIMPFLEQLSGNFTGYAIEDAAELKTVYGIRFYELFRQHEKFGKRYMSLTEIREVFDLKDKYKQLAGLYRRVIEPAKEDINKNSKMNVEVDTVKEGRRVTGYLFTFKREKPCRFEAAKEKILSQANDGESFVINGDSIWIGEEIEGDVICIDRSQRQYSLNEVLKKASYSWSIIHKDSGRRKSAWTVNKDGKLKQIRSKK